MSLIKDEESKSSLSDEEKKYLRARKGEAKGKTKKESESSGIRTMTGDIAKMFSIESETGREQGFLKDLKGKEKKFFEEKKKIGIKEKSRGKEEYAARFGREKEKRVKIRIEREREIEEMRRKKEEERQKKILGERKKRSERAGNGKLLLFKIREEKEKIRQLFQEKKKLLLEKREKEREIGRKSYAFSRKGREFNNLLRKYQKVVFPFEADREQRLKLAVGKDEIQESIKDIKEEIQAKASLIEEFRKEREMLENELEDLISKKRKIIDKIREIIEPLFPGFANVCFEDEAKRNLSNEDAAFKKNSNFEEEEEEIFDFSGTKLGAELKRLMDMRKIVFSEVNIIRTEIPVFERKIEEMEKNIRKKDEEKGGIQLKIQEFKAPSLKMKMQETRREIEKIRKEQFNLLRQREKLLSRLEAIEEEIETLQEKKKVLEEKISEEKEKSRNLINAILEKKRSVIKEKKQLELDIQNESEETAQISQEIKEIKNLSFLGNQREERKKIEEKKEKLAEEIKYLQEEKERILNFLEG